jgi:hypothetical protein
MIAQIVVHMAGKTAKMDTHSTNHTMIPGAAKKAPHAAAHPQKKCQRD